MIENRASNHESKFLFNKKDLLPEISKHKFNTDDFYSTHKARTTLPLNIAQRKQRSMTRADGERESTHSPTKPAATTTVPRSWTDNSFFRNNLDCYLIKYSQMSRSERFLDLLELSKNQGWSGTTLNSIDSISSITNSPLFTKTSKRNLPKYESKLTDSSSEESISSSPEESVVPQGPVVFMCDPEDSSRTNAINVKIECQTLNRSIEENGEPSPETPDSVANTETTRAVTNPVPEPMSDNTSNESTGSSDRSSLLSTTLNDSQGSCGDISGSTKSTSPSETTDNLRRSNLLSNEINQTLSRDMFEKNMPDIRPKEKNTSSPNDSSDESGEDDLLIRMPKKSCLKKFLQELSDECLLLDSTADATSSPLGSPRSMNSSLQWSSTTCEGASSSQNQSLSSSSVNSSIQRREKKRVSFADVCGKDLFTVRTMSEPSNCPPKLTSKIVQYFLNREFNYGSQMTDYSYSQNSYHSGDYYASRLQRRDSFFSTSRSYDYGINASNYTNDVNQLKGSIAVYSLNFGQPASDYFKFRQRLEENSVSLENVLLNGFQINGTIKVKNISFEKKVLIRCSFNKWQNYQDYEAAYVASDFYSASSSMHSPSGSPYSAAFCGTNNGHYEPQHKEYDTFRFEFKLPKHAEPEAMNRPNPANSNNCTKSNITASIQFCICYQSGAGNGLREYWDSNGGTNYEILQYVIDLERLKNHHSTSAALNQKYQKNKKNYFNSSGVLGSGMPLDGEIYY